MERAVMKLTGMSRSQVRALSSLQDFGQQIRAQQAARGEIAPPDAGLQVRENKFERLGMQGQNAGVAGAPGAAGGQQITAILGVEGEGAEADQFFAEEVVFNVTSRTRLE